MFTVGVMLQWHSSCEAEVMVASEGIGGIVVARGVVWGHSEIEIKGDSSAAHAFFHRRNVGRMKPRDSRILRQQEKIVVEGVSEEVTENTKLGRHVDAYTTCEGTGGISTVDESQELQ